MGIGRRPGNAGKHRWPAAEGRAEQGSLTLEAFLFISWCFSILASGFRDSAREGRYGAMLWYVLPGSLGTSLGKHASPQAQLHWPLGSDCLQCCSLPIAQSSCLHISFEEEGVETCRVFSCSLRTEPRWGQRQALAKPCPAVELPPGELRWGSELWPSTGTGEVGARLCATRPWMYLGALISLHPFEWKLFGALFIDYVTKLRPNSGTGFWVVQ